MSNLVHQTDLVLRVALGIRMIPPEFGGFLFLCYLASHLTYRKVQAKEVYVFTRSFVILILLVFPVTSCAVGGDLEESDHLSTKDLATKIVNVGLTCQVQQDIVSLSEGDSKEVRNEVATLVSREDWASIVEDREPNCNPNDSGEMGLVNAGVANQAITGTYSVVFIPELSTVSVGWSPTFIFRDGSSYDDMCGGDWPADYIAEFHDVANAYSSQGSLRMMGLNSDGNCYVDGDTASRVYSDDDIRSCFGYWTVWGCGGTFDSSDIRVYHN